MADFSGDDAFNVFVRVRALRYVRHAGGNYPGGGGGGGIVQRAIVLIPI